MKKLTTLLICLFSLSAMSQLDVINTESAVEIGKISNFGQLSIGCEKIGEKYVFTYQDVKFQHVVDYKTFFLRNEKEFEDLYELITENWKNPPSENIMINLEEGYLWVRFTSSLGVTNVSFGHSVDDNVDIVGFSAWLTKRRVDRLFGKR